MKLRSNVRWNVGTIAHVRHGVMAAMQEFALETCSCWAGGSKDDGFGCCHHFDRRAWGSLNVEATELELMLFIRSTESKHDEISFSLPQVALCDDSG